MDVFEFTEAYYKFLAVGKQVMDSIEESFAGMEDDLEDAGIEVKRLCWFELHLVCRNTVNIFFRSVFSGGKPILEAGVLSHDQSGPRHNVISAKALLQSQPGLVFEDQGERSLAEWLIRDVTGEVMQRVLADFKLIPCHQTHSFYLVDRGS